MGKSSDAPAPDPRLTEAQIRSIDKQGLFMDKIMANSDAMLPLQQEQLRWGLDTSRQAWDQTQADREWMLNRRGALSGLQDRLVQDANTFNTEARRQELAGEALGDVNQAFDSVRGQGLRTMARMGINPNDGRMMSFNNQTGNAQALAMATAANKVRQAARAEGMAMTDRATNALAGYPAMGMQATQAGAGYGSAGLGLANAGLAGMNSGYGAGGQLAGQMGQNATGAFNAQANYKLQSDQAANEPLGALFGVAGQLGAAWLGGWR